MNARQIGNALNELRSNGNLEVSSTGDEWDYTVKVYQEATTYGPAMDPVETWADQHPEMTVEKVIGGTSAHTYGVELPN